MKPLVRHRRIGENSNKTDLKEVGYKLTKLIKLTKDLPVVRYCEHGKASLRISFILVAAGEILACCRTL
jgi:hypothetical protein